MSGTFYHSPAPGEPPFVKVGDKVTKGQTIGIIEAMKLMNEIEASRHYPCLPYFVISTSENNIIDAAKHCSPLLVKGATSLQAGCCVACLPLPL